MEAWTSERWERERTFHHSAFSAEWLVAQREDTISICLPARNEAATIGPILNDLMPLLEAGAIDQVVVVDDSEDGTADIARALGAEVHSQSALCSQLGPVQGKGDAMWRALTVLSGGVVCYLDADSRAFGPHFATALAGAVATPGPVSFAKAFYRRPFQTAAGTSPEGGGRVTELCARPLLQWLYPELSGVRQPLSGEIAARRELLERLPFLCRYAVDVGLLIDVWREVGLDGMAQVDLDVRQNRHRALSELGSMALDVSGAILHRVCDEGRLIESPRARFASVHSASGAGGFGAQVVERPPMERAYAAADEALTE